ncbi:hypothetical protein DSLASN_01550 [Desulfoluna limicola]|uniref:DUF4468 domain-containing protein n=1 Tax=Desulfoluna limicola TaxID=2810562 RepID=A0ABM7PBF8_9BACT|nr:DUF4468 domain-containing protein [Desulfoluna limicola]BCS94523.1 hypothetical protein DSLASN_01550 [Desulfoluna limicola]
MKVVTSRIFALVLMCVFFYGCASLQVSPPEERVIQQVHNVDMPKDQIFDKCLEWMAQTFVSSKAVIELKDKNNGKIIGKGVTEFVRGGLATIPCRYTIIIDIKDNKYRTTYDNWVGMWGEYRNIPQPLKYKDCVDPVREKLMALDADLYSYLTSSNQSEDW